MVDFDTWARTISSEATARNWLIGSSDVSKTWDSMFKQIQPPDHLSRRLRGVSF
jgi:hypothetical protein